ncbi:copper resistance protein NlpE [Vulcaniibacterium gelatinicum]|uniref:copper resistance protein NlpE n=1 Tax=Vulcaniibacterium gelatinicum TaxID=2598725 RepID=UPI001C6FF84D|nr:copper resistance protein NlpE [Vulcaniibacterium gelatinicum]
MSSKMPAFAAFLLLALAACQREAPPAQEAGADPASATATPAPEAETGATAALPAPADAAAPADDPLAGTDAIAVEDHGNAASAGFDSKGFAGIFRGTLPCADCPGIETRLQLEADGSYTLEETYLERGGPYASNGTWTAEENGKRLRLDPNGKDQDDRLYAILSQDRLRLLDTAGGPIESGLPYELARAAQ